MDNMHERVPHCDMKRNCTSPVTHIGSKGYIYCAEHAVTRSQSGYEHTRKMRQWEIDLINAGQPLPSYEPLPRSYAEPIIVSIPDPKALGKALGHDSWDDDAEVQHGS